MATVCASCGAQGVSGKFCSECGASLATSCLTCGAATSTGQKFCSECGTPLGAAPAPAVRAEPVASAPAAERRVCSVLFADLVGFTPLSEAQDPEAVRELLTAYFDRARTVITRYGGTVEKFIGDAVMAVWGAPTATEGDAERAVRAGLDLVGAVTELGIEKGLDGLAARAGVVTGEVAVTLGATGQGMVAGDAVNTAARVQSAASPGQVWVDDPTRRLASASVDFADAGAHALKGKTEPASLWQAVRVVSGTGGSQRVDGLEAPLIGRDSDLRLVKELFHAAVERRSAGLVVISGPAGVGKSRLGWEFEKYVDGLADVMWWHRGRCLSYGDGIAYWAFAEMVRQRFGIADEDPLDLAAAKLVDQLPRFVPDAAERAFVHPRLARLLGITGADDEPLTRDDLFAGWRLFLERLADAGAVVLLVEDAHYAPSPLLDFLDHVVDWARNSPIYVLVFARPELAQQNPGWGVGRNRTQLNLELLDARAMSALLDSLVPDMPAPAVAAITRQAEGNPLFAVETVRSLIDRDVIVPHEGQYRLVGDVTALSVPDSLHALLAARLDALSPDVRTLVADAAVLGASFPAEAIVAVSGSDADAVHAGLADLVRRGVLEISADPLSPQRGSYKFAQDMLRQVAYDTLSRRDRKTRHLTVAAHLRSAFDGDEISDVIARHYLDAVAAVPDDADVPEIRALATDTLLTAATHAEKTGAPLRAAANYATAADLVADDPDPVMRERAAAHYEAATAAARVGGDVRAVRRYADRAHAVYTALGRDREAARALTEAGFSAAMDGDFTEARDLFGRALAVLEIDPDHDTVNALAELARLEIFDGSPLGSEISERALVLGQSLGVPDDELARLFTTRATAYNFTDEHHRAVALFRHAAALAEHTGSTVNLALAQLNLSATQLGWDPAEAARVARAANDHARRLGALNHLAIGVVNLCVAQLLVGEWDAAVRELAHAADDGFADDESLVAISTVLSALRGDLSAASAEPAQLSTLRASDSKQDRALADLADALLASSSGRFADGLQAALRAVESETSNGLGSDAVLLAYPAALHAALELDDHDAVRRLTTRLTGFSVGQLPHLLRATLALAEASLLVVDDPPAAEAAFAHAITLHQAAKSPFHLAHALVEQGRARVALGAANAFLPIAVAGTIAEQLGARPLRARIERVQAGETQPA